MRKFLSLLMMVAFSVAMFANSYWYRGVDNSWGATAMTESTDGLYEYIQSSNNANQFKIATSADSWDYGWTYVQAGFNSTDVTNIGDYGQDNCYCWQSGAYYILVYKPNTSVNTTANPIICAATTLPEAAGDPDQMYVWNGIGVTTAAAATELGGAAEAIQADANNNIVAGASQKGNWCLKANKGFTNGAYYLGIAMNNGINAGDTIKIAYFRTSSKSTYVLGMDFSADKASAATTYQILSQGDPQTLESNGTPVDSIFIVPEGVENAKYMRIYRNSGGTGLWVAKVEIVKKAGETPEQPEQPEENVLPVVKLAGSLSSWSEPALMVNAEDSLSASVTLNLGIDHYQLKVVSDGNWLSKAGEDDLFTMHRDYPHVDHLNLINTGDNIKLITDVAGEYTFTWTYADSTLVVTFPEAPAKPNYYLIGDSAFVVDAGATADKAWTPDAIPSFQDTTVLNLKAGVNYIMRLSLEGTWENHRDFRHLTDTAAGLIELPDEFGNHSIGFSLAEAGEVTIIYIPATNEQPEVFKLIGNFYVYVPQFTDGYYLVGNQYNWTPAAERLFTANPETEGEFFLDSVVLAADDSLKVVYVENDQFLNWYPEGNNYVVDANHAGTKTIYFNPNYQKEWGGNIFIAENPAPKEYYAKYAPAWEWTKLTEAEGLWLTDTIVYGGIGININDKADDENNMFYSNTVEEEGVRPIAGAEIDENDTIYFTFNPADSVVTAVMVGKYVAPDPTVAVMGSMNDWAEEIPFVLSDDKTYASLTVENIGADEYEFKFIINGEWRSNGYRFHREFTGAAGITENNEANMVFVADQDGKYTFYWYFANDSAAIVYPAKPEPVLANGYYLVGSMNEWTPAAENLFALNPDNDAEYQLAINLDVNTAIKVVYVENDAIVTWYPAEGENYVIDDHHNGSTTVYFRPDGQGGEGWHCGTIYVVPTSTVDITNIDANAPAVKVMRNGQMFIIKGDKTYNVMGIMVR